MPRTERYNWAAPFVATHDGRAADRRQRRHRCAATTSTPGTLLWEAAGLGENSIPQPVQHGDLVFAMSGHTVKMLMAIRLGRSRRPDRHGRHRLVDGARRVVHAVAAAARRPALRRQRQRPGELSRRGDRQAALPAAAAAEAVQLQGVAGRRERQALPRHRRRRRRRRADRATGSRCWRPTRWPISRSSRRRSSSTATIYLRSRTHLFAIDKN